MSRGGENFALPKRNSFLYYSQTFFPFPVVLTTRHQQATVGTSSRAAAAFPFKKFRIGYCQPPILPLVPNFVKGRLGTIKYFQSFNPWQFQIGNSVKGIHRNQVKVSDKLKFEVA